MIERLSIRAFARRARCDEKQVRRAIQYGQLLRGSDGLLDANQLGNGWHKTNRRGRLNVENTGADNANIRTVAIQAHNETPEHAAERIASTVTPYSCAEARRISENFTALLLKLEYGIKSGALVDLSAVELAFFNAARTWRDAWMNWPLMAGPILAADLGVETDRVTDLLARLVHDQISQLASRERGRTAISAPS